MNLQTALLDLLYELHGTDVKLIIGGGYGIYLRVEHVRKSGMATLFQEWPEARSTNDLDLFLRPELLIASEKLRPLSDALNNLGYRAIPSAAKYQFIKTTETSNLKIDILTGPERCFRGTKVRTDSRRVKPNPSIGIHAHPADEALTLEENLSCKTVSGTLSTGASYDAEVYLPHLYTFLMMKLFAFKDRYEDSNKEYGRYHALDMYTILATTIENEWNQAIEIRDHYQGEPFIIAAGNLVHEFFSAPDRIGILRLKESRYYRPELQLEKFMEDIQELFPVIS